MDRNYLDYKNNSAARLFRCCCNKGVPALTSLTWEDLCKDNKVSFPRV